MKLFQLPIRSLSHPQEVFQTAPGSSVVSWQVGMVAQLPGALRLCVLMHDFSVLIWDHDTLRQVYMTCQDMVSLLCIAWYENTDKFVQRGLPLPPQSQKADVPSHVSFLSSLPCISTSKLSDEQQQRQFREPRRSAFFPCLGSSWDVEFGTKGDISRSSGFL